MADEEEDDLAALRNAVLASMKPKPKKNTRENSDDDIDIEALRVAALKTKKPELNCDNSILPVEAISSIGHGSPYKDASPYREQIQIGSPFRDAQFGEQLQANSPQRQGFHLGASPHRQNFPTFHQSRGQPHRGNFHQGRRGRGRGFGPNAPFTSNQSLPPTSSSNLIVLTAAPTTEPNQSKNAGNQKGHSNTTALENLVRPQDKYAGSSSVVQESVKAKPKGPAKFSRLEDSDSDSDESDDDDYGISSVKEAISSSSSSSDEETVECEKDNTPVVKGEEALSADTVNVQSADVSMSEQATGSTTSQMPNMPQNATKPDYTRVPPPALSPMPSPSHEPVVAPPTQNNSDSSFKGNKLVPEKEVTTNQTESISLRESIGSANSDNNAKHNRQEVKHDDQDARSSPNNDNSTFHTHDKSVVAGSSSKNVTTVMSLSNPPQSSMHDVQKVKSESKDSVEPTQRNGQSRSNSLSSGSELSTSSSSSSSSISLSDSDSGSDSACRDKSKAIERGKDDIERERRQRVVREREEHRKTRHNTDRPNIKKDMKPAMDRSRLPRAYADTNSDLIRHTRSTDHARSDRWSQNWDRSHREERRKYAQNTQSRYAQSKPDQYKRPHENENRDRISNIKENHKSKERRSKDPSMKDEYRQKTISHDDMKQKQLKNDQHRHHSSQEVLKHARHERSRGDHMNRGNSRNKTSQERIHQYGNSGDITNTDKQFHRSDTKPDLRQTLLSKHNTGTRMVESESDLSDFSTGSEFDSPPPKLRSVTQVVKGSSKEPDHFSASQRPINKGHKHTRVQSAGRQRHSKGKNDEQPAKMIVEANPCEAKNKDARQIICSLKGVRDSASSERTKTTKHSPKINITFKDDAVVEEKPSKNRLSVHDRLGMPVKQDKENAVLDDEPTVLRRVITEDSCDARHHLKARRKRNDDEKCDIDHQTNMSRNVTSVETERPQSLKDGHKTDSIKDSKRIRHKKKSRHRVSEDVPIDARDRLKERRKDRLADPEREITKSRRVVTENLVEEHGLLKDQVDEPQRLLAKPRDMLKNQARSEDSRKKKDYRIWSNKREVSIDTDTDEVVEPPPSWVDHQSARQSQKPNWSPDNRLALPDELDNKIEDARSRLTNRRGKKRIMEHRLGSVVSVRPQHDGGYADVEKKSTRREEKTDGDKEAELNARIQRIREKNASIERRRHEVEQDKQRYASYS